MKFTDGNWMMRKGVRAYYPAQAYEVEAGRDSLTVYAPTKPIRHRGDTLDGPLLTVRFFSPLPDVIGVRLSHFAGGQDPGPHFPLCAPQAEGVAAALAAEDGCLARLRATALQSAVIDAVNARRLPPRFQETLLGSVNDLVSRITCAPPPPPPRDHGHHDHHGKHGEGD